MTENDIFKKIFALQRNAIDVKKMDYIALLPQLYQSKQLKKRKEAVLQVW